MPFSNAMVAKVWRRSWNRTCLHPARVSRIDRISPTDVGYQKRKGRFSVAVDYPEDVKYVMPFDIGREYKVIRSKQHRCSKCRHVMRPIKKNKKLKCPECGETLKKGDSINWD